MLRSPHRNDGVTKMREGTLAILFGGALTLLPAAAYAGSVPKELYGKSITVQWSESLIGRRAGDQTTQNWLRVYLMNIYISNAGRPFVRWTGRGMQTQKIYGGLGASQGSFSTAPGQTSSDAADHVDFQGRSVAVYSEFQSGARRIAIGLDGGHGSPGRNFFDPGWYRELRRPRW
jgi:hypothetical protein